MITALRGALKPTAGRVVRVIRDTTEWRGFEAQWKALWEVSPTASPPLRWEWLWEWWRLYGDAYADGGRGLRVFVIERESALVAALPMYVGQSLGNPLAPKDLRFLSTGEAQSEETCAEYLDLLHEPGKAAFAEQAFASAVAEEMSEGLGRIQLSSLSTESPLLNWADRFESDGYVVRKNLSGPTFVANLEGGCDAYLARLSANSRSQARRLLRGVNSEKLSFELATDAHAIDRAYRELVDLHQARWQTAGQPGCFASRRFTEFHRALAHQLAPIGGAVLARLAIKDKPLAVIQGYVSRGKFDFYLSGTALDADAPVRSPGIAAHLCLKVHLAAQGITRYDYLPGTSRYKAQYSTDEYPLAHFVLEKPGIAALAHRVSDTGIRAARKALLLVRRSSDTRPAPSPSLKAPDANYLASMPRDVI